MEPFSKDLGTVEINGNNITLPRLTLRKTMHATKAVADLLLAVKEKLPADVDIVNLLRNSATDANASVNFGSEVLKLIPHMLPQVIDQAAEVVAVYLDISKDEVLDKFDLNDIVKVLIPFFTNILSQGNTALAHPALKLVK